jgi:glycosyltransferase involved in cell wall biosynthesis
VIDEGRLPPTDTTRSAPGAITVALTQDLNLGPYGEAIESGRRPRHVLLDLAQRTGGIAVTRRGARPGLIDRLAGRLIGDAGSWWVARQALQRSNGGYIHANNESVGIPLLALQHFSRRRSARVGFWVMVPDGPRVRLWLMLIKLLRLRPILLAESEAKAGVLRRLAGTRVRVLALAAPMDLRFFSPGPTLARTGPPLVVSAGLERRDYRTLAAAVDGLDVEVQICAVSPDANTRSAAMPDQRPSNMTFVDLELAALRDLYRAADVVVVPTMTNTIDAGGTTVLEAMACGRPVVASGQGMFLDLGRQGLLRTADVGSPIDLRRVLTELLSSPAEAHALGSAARAGMDPSHADQLWLANLIDEVRRGGVVVNDEAEPTPTARAGELATG